MNGLVIKKKWLDLILSGEKTWEIRGSKTKVRGRIALIESGSGMVVGEAHLVEVLGPLTTRAMLNSVTKHQVPAATIRRGLRYKTPHAWVMTKAKRYRKPKPYDHPPGAVIWVKDVA